MFSEWMKVMLEEIEQKKLQEQQAALEAERREREAVEPQPLSPRDASRRASG
jgi:hypothetical protein